MKMEFKFADGAYFATNSAKPVTINKFEEDCFQLLMVKGDKTMNHPLHVHFETFDEAAAFAENVVGFQADDKPMRFKMSHGPDGDLRMSRQN